MECSKKKGFLLLMVFIFLLPSFLFSADDKQAKLTTEQVATLIHQSKLDKTFNMVATPEITAEVNKIRYDTEDRRTFNLALSRMKQYEKMIRTALKQKNMPDAFLAMPIVESEYQSKQVKIDASTPAGIWQLTPATGRKFGLIINQQRDDRLNAERQTQAALNYLLHAHNQFGDWQLAIISYQYGDDAVKDLIDKVGSRDVWTLVRSKAAPEKLKSYLTKMNATILIMKNPDLVEDNQSE